MFKRRHTNRAASAGTNRTRTQPRTNTTASSQLGSIPEWGPAMMSTEKNATTATSANDTTYVRAVRNTRIDFLSHDRGIAPVVMMQGFTTTSECSYLSGTRGIVVHQFARRRERTTYPAQLTSTTKTTI